MSTDRQQLIRFLFERYMEMYAGRDDRLTEHFSENFSGFAGGGDVLVKDRAEWVQVTRQDFAQVPNLLHIDMLDLALQDISEDVVMATGFFHIQLPMVDTILSRESARLVLVFRREGEDWKIVSSTISIPYNLVRKDEVYPLTSLYERNRELEQIVAERTRQLEQSNARLEALSNTDGLTGIANRRKFDGYLELEWSRAQRAGAPLALILLDVDHFKHFNDCYGHPSGDGCLRAIAQALARAERRSGHLVARYGGEEFVLLLPDTEQEGALETARRVQQEVWALAMPHAGMDPAIVTVSLGVACMVPARPHTADELVSRADTALYQAKSLGRNRVQLAAD
jgi:diguanylate cyclase (GGDEF)-like protein